MKLKNLSLILTVLLFFIPACGTAPTKAKEEKIVIGGKLAQKVQDEKALELFNKVLSVTEEAADRKEILSKMEALYDEIVNNYPDARIAEESYMRLIVMCIEEFDPPKVYKAEMLHQNFLKKYPDSTLKIYTEQSFGMFYYKNKMWDKLLRFFTPQVRKFIQTGKLDNPYHLYMYSEAKFNLRDLAEAEKGYKIVIEFFPKSKEGESSKNRLEEIQKLKKRDGGA